MRALQGRAVPVQVPLVQASWRSTLSICFACALAAPACLATCTLHFAHIPLIRCPIAPRSNNVKKRVNMEQLASGLNKQKVIEKVRHPCIWKQSQR